MITSAPRMAHGDPTTAHTRSANNARSSGRQSRGSGLLLATPGDSFHPGYSGHGYSPTPSNFTGASGWSSARHRGHSGLSASRITRNASLVSHFDDPRASTLKGRTIAPYVHTDFAGTYDNIDMYGSIFHFNNPEIEFAYYQHINSLFGPQLVVAGVFGFIAALCTSLVLAVGMIRNMSQPYPVFTNTVIALESICVLMAIYFLTYRLFGITWMRKRNELALYIGLAITSLAASTAAIVVLLLTDFNDAAKSEKYNILFVVLLTAYFYYLLVIAGVANIFPCRVKYLAVFTTLLAIPMTAVVVLYDHTTRQALYMEDSSFSVMGIVLVLGTWSWAVLNFGARCTAELRERVDFYQYTSTRTRALKLAGELRQSTGKRKRRGGATGVEEVLQMIREAQNLIRVVESVLQNVDLKEANSLLDVTLGKLTNTGQLFKMNLDNVDASKQDAIMNVVNAFVHQQPADRGRVQATFDQQHSSKTKSVELARIVRNRIRQGTVKGTGKTVQFEDSPTPVQSSVPKCVLGAQLAGIAGVRWHLNLLEMSRDNPNILLEVGTAIVTDSVDRFGVELEMLQNLFHQIQLRYFANPYHNAVHGATVAHTAMSLCRTLGVVNGALFGPTEEMTFIIAALGHDIGHPGRNNAFFVNVVHPLALLYNDVSVLENFHCALLFDLLTKPECNVYEDSSLNEYRAVRSLIIDLVLATDMKRHFEGQSKFRVRRASPEFDFESNIDDLGLILQMCLKAGDLSHGALDWVQHVEWSMRVTEEFYKQGDQEKTCGLPKSPLCDRSTHAGLAKSQQGFIEFVVQPLYLELDGVANGVLQSTCMMRLAENKVRWEERASLNVVTPMPEAVAQVATHVPYLKALINELATAISFGATIKSTYQSQKSMGALMTLKSKKTIGKVKKGSRGTQTDYVEGDDDEDVPPMTRGLSTAICNVARTPYSDSLGGTPAL